MGIESSTGKSRSRGPAGKGGGGGGSGIAPGKSGTLERSSTLDSVGSGSGAAGGLNSRDGRRTWTDAESDRLREVVELSDGEPLGMLLQVMWAGLFLWLVLEVSLFGRG